MELIKVTEQNGKQVVSARDLHQYLDATERFSQWIERQFQYGFIENVDYVGCKEFHTLAKQELNDFALTIDCAKEISMLQKSEKGKQARMYFIECEKRLNKPMSQIELILHSAQMLADMERKQLALENRIEQIENRPQINAPIEHFSIMGYCHNIGKQIGLNQAKEYGIKARSMCNQLGLVIGKIPDPRFGSVNTYPLDVLEQIIM